MKQLTVEWQQTSANCRADGYSADDWKLIEEQRRPGATQSGMHYRLRRLQQRLPGGPRPGDPAAPDILVLDSLNIIHDPTTKSQMFVLAWRLFALHRFHRRTRFITLLEDSS